MTRAGFELCLEQKVNMLTIEPWGPYISLRPLMQFTLELLPIRAFLEEGSYPW